MPSAGLAQPAQELLHLRGLGVAARAGSPCNGVVGLDEEAAPVEAGAPHLDDPEDAQQLSPIDGSALLRPGELQPRLLALAAQVDQLARAEVARIGPGLDRRARPRRWGDGDAVVPLELLVPPIEVAPERVAKRHWPPRAAHGSNLASLPLDLEADEGGEHALEVDPGVGHNLGGEDEVAQQNRELSRVDHMQLGRPSSGSPGEPRVEPDTQLRLASSGEGDAAGRARVVAQQEAEKLDNLRGAPSLMRRPLEAELSE